MPFRFQDTFGLSTIHIHVLHDSFGPLHGCRNHLVRRAKQVLSRIQIAIDDYPRNDCDDRLRPWSIPA
jgi:hypothetical protein